MEINVYEVEPGRWGYRVEFVVQEWHPLAEGFVPMTQSEAEFFAQEVYERLQVQ